MKNTRLLTIFAILILSLGLTTGVLAAASMAGKHHLMNAANPAFSGKPQKPEITELDLISSTNKSDWSAVDGSMGEGFRMTLNPEVTYHYLDSDLVTSTKTLTEGLHGFYVDTVHDEASFFVYWAGKGVTVSATGPWQPTMWQIINGDLPIFYLDVESEESGGQPSSLVDGLLYALGTTDNEGNDYLRVNGDHPTGLYTYSGTITDTQDVTNTQTVSITFEAPHRQPEPVFLPLILNNYPAPIFYDPFDTDKSWTIISSGGYDYEIFGGEYYITHTVADRNVKSIAPVTSAEIPSQYVIEADMSLPAGSNDETRYGLVFDFFDANRFYIFYVSPKNQQWWIYKYNYGWSEIDSSTSANTNINQTGNNHLKIERNGDQINAYVKGYELGPWSPHSDFTGNQAGLVLISSISLSGGESAVAAYDNFLITDLYP